MTPSRLMCSQLRPQDVLLLDNPPVRQASQVEAAAAGVKAEVRRLPAYPPDFSPIEEGQAVLKNSMFIRL